MLSIFSKFQKGLQKTATALGRSIAGVFSEVKKWDAASFQTLENGLLEADFGPDTTKKLVSDLKERYQLGKISGAEDILQAAENDIINLLRPEARSMHTAENGMTTILLVGVNGSGKTTTAGKMAHQLIESGKKVTLAACDTFRAAAAEQLKLWADKTGAHLVSSKQGADPSAVAFDAVKSALARKSDYLIIDTAGRQHNKKSLMDELAKMRRIITKLQPDAPHETILTVDASMGTNAVAQAKEFADASGASAVVLTKLDGTGRGGSAVRIQTEYHLPVLFVGLGEQPDDLQPFDAAHYAHALFHTKE